MENQNQQPNQQPPFQQPQYQQPPFQPNYAQGQRPGKPDNYLVWAILSTIFCCLPLGIVSIVYSSKVDSQYNAGDYLGAQDSADKAKKFAMWGAIAAVICIVLYILLIVVLGVAGSVFDKY